MWQSSTVAMMPPLRKPNPLSCSGHGTCVNTVNGTTGETSGLCQCSSGYSGTVCETQSSCGGLTDGRGQCCPASAILDVNFECCVGVLAANGSCCASGILNACGECDGPVTAVVSVIGQCCALGVLDASGLCCGSGKLNCQQWS